MAESDIYNAKRLAIEKKRADRKAKAEADWKEDMGKIGSKINPMVGIFAIGGVLFTTPIGWAIDIAVLLLCFFICHIMNQDFTYGFFAAVAILLAGIVVVGIVSATSSNQNDDQRTRAAKSKKLRADKAADQDYQQETAQLDKWYADFQQQVKAQAVQYIRSAEVPWLADILADRYVSQIETALRDTSVKMVDVKLDYRVERDQIRYLGGGYVIRFAEERIDPLTSDVQCVALAMTLCQYIVQLISRKYPQCKLTSVHNDAMYILQYTGLNLNYVPNKTF